MKAPGFVLIELLIALLIASFLSIGMINSLTMIFKTNSVVDNIIDTSALEVRLQQQLERDLSGVMIPSSLLVTATDTVTTDTVIKKGQASVASEPVKPALQPYKNRYLFFSTKKDASTDLFTFITTNPLASFWSDSAGQAQSRLVRVVYRLEPDKENPPYFKLFRQEGMDLDFARYAQGAKNPIRRLEIARFIKSFSMKFLAEEKPVKEDASLRNDAKNQKQSPQKISAQTTQADKKTVNYSSHNEWRIEENPDEKARKKMSKYPRFIELSFTTVEAKSKQEATFEMVFSLPCDDEPFAKRPKKQQQAQQASASPAQKPGGIRARLAQAGKPKTVPGSLLGQFTQSLGVRA